MSILSGKIYKPHPIIGTCDRMEKTNRLGKKEVLYLGTGMTLLLLVLLV